jgi:hypothetical protein
LDDASDKMLTVNGISFEDAANDEDTTEQPPSLYEAMDMTRRLHLLSITQQPELYLCVMQLQSKLIDVCLDSNISKQRSIRDFFKPV